MCLSNIFIFKAGTALIKALSTAIGSGATSGTATSVSEGNQQLSSNALVSALDTIQGLCLLHYPTKFAVGVECRAIKLILARLEAYCEGHGGTPSKRSNTNETHQKLTRRKSTLLEIVNLDDQAVLACLDTLLAILVDHDLCQIDFRQSNGVSYIIDLISTVGAPREVRAKSAEFVLFLVRYLTESKDENQRLVLQYLGEPLTLALTQSVTSTAKGLDKFDVFLKKIDESSSSPASQLSSQNTSTNSSTSSRRSTLSPESASRSSSTSSSSISPSRR